MQYVTFKLLIINIFVLKSDLIFFNNDKFELKNKK